jgi:hypothetical protein
MSLVGLTRHFFPCLGSFLPCQWEDKMAERLPWLLFFSHPSDLTPIIMPKPEKFLKLGTQFARDFHGSF